MKAIKKLVVVMGGGVDEDFNLPLHVKQRCDYVIETIEKDEFVLASSCFTLNIPIKTKNGFPVSEATTIYEYLIENAPKILANCEQLSHDTIGSILFTLELYAKNMGVKKVKFVTSDFHKKRVLLISGFINSICFGGFFEIDVHGCASGLDCKERIAKEDKSCADFIKSYSGIVKKNELISKILLEHSNYNNEFSSERGNFKNLYY